VFSDPRDVAHEPNDSPPSGYPTLREVNSQELMQGTREIIIRHGEEAYRLSVTRSGKLILRK
jgi:hemin uptake protein HemP